MDSWWELGEGRGVRGKQLDLALITCAFCDERGNFGVLAKHQKAKPNDPSKTLNYVTLACGRCSNMTMALWSASSVMDAHDFRVLPWHSRTDRHPEHWPADVGRLWLQAKKAVRMESWDAAAVMARSALQVALRDKQAQGRTLMQEIEDLAGKGLLPPLMKEWAHNLRELGNDSAHPHPGQTATEGSDARDVMAFLDFLLEYLYDLPTRIAQYQERKPK